MPDLTKYSGLTRARCRHPVTISLAIVQVYEAKELGVLDLITRYSDPHVDNFDIGRLGNDKTGAASAGAYTEKDIHTLENSSP